MARSFNVNARIGKVLETCTADALDILRDSHLLYSFRHRADDKLPDFWVIDNDWDTWEIEAKNWQLYGAPTRKPDEFEKTWAVSAPHRVLLVSFWNVTREVDLALSDTVKVKIGRQVTPENYTESRTIVVDKLAELFGASFELRAKVRKEIERLGL